MNAQKIWSALRAIVRPRDEWLIFFLGVFLFFIGTNTQTGWLYVVVSFLAALLLIGFAMPRLTLRDLHVKRSLPQAASEGDTVDVRLRVTNHGKARRFLVVAHDNPPGQPEKRFLIGQIAPDGSARMQYSLPCPRRGVYRLGDLALVSGTPVGLFPHKRTFPNEDALVVYPVGPKMSRLTSDNLMQMHSTSHRTFNRAGSSFDLLGIREYKHGDDTRHLHWASTARAGKLMVREFQEPGAQSMAVLIENNALSGVSRPGGDSPLDVAARFAASHVAYAHEIGAGLTLVAGERDVSTTTSAGRGSEALDWLARLKASSMINWSALVEDALPGLPRRGALVMLLVTPTVDARALSVLSEQGVKPHIIFLAAPSFTDEDLGITARHYEDAVEALRREGMHARVQTHGEPYVLGDAT